MIDMPFVEAIPIFGHRQAVPINHPTEEHYKHLRFLRRKICYMFEVVSAGYLLGEFVRGYCGKGYSHLLDVPDEKLEQIYEYLSEGFEYDNEKGNKEFRRKLNEFVGFPQDEEVIGGEE